jgi:hypothetical protein
MKAMRALPVVALSMGAVSLVGCFSKSDGSPDATSGCTSSAGLPTTCEEAGPDAALDEDAAPRDAGATEAASIDATRDATLGTTPVPANAMIASWQPTSALPTVRYGVAVAAFASP